MSNFSMALHLGMVFLLGHNISL